MSGFIMNDLICNQVDEQNYGSKPFLADTRQIQKTVKDISEILQSV